MSRNYKFHNPDGLYFMSFAVIGWLDVFIRNEYKDLFIESLVYYQKEKGLEMDPFRKVRRFCRLNKNSRVVCLGVLVL